jgi:NhaC family Na+:H+ antiporter
MKKKEKFERPVKFAEATIILIAIIAVIIFNAIYLKLGTGISVLSVATLAATYALLVLKIKWDDILDEIFNVFKVGMGAVLILLMVGIIGSSWTIGGTTPMLIYYGLKLISPGLYLVVSFLITLVLGIATGSAWAIIGSVGIALMGVAQGLGVPIAPAAAAIAMGSYVGDMWSPFSDVPNLSAASTRGTSFDVFKAMIPTQVPAILVGMIIYTVLGLSLSTSNTFDNTVVLEIQNALSSVYNWNFTLLLPPIIVIVGAAMKFPTIPILTLSAVVAVLQAVIFQGMDFAPAINALYSGSVSNTGNAGIDGLLSGGGLLSMMSLILIIFCAFIFAGIIERMGVLKTVLGDLSNRISNKGHIILISMLSSILSVYLTSSVYVATIINARIWSDVYKKNGMSTLNLSRTMCGGMSNWGLIVPWSGGVAVMLNTFNLQWYEYAPYLFTLWASMALIVIFGYTDKFIIPLEEDEKEALQNEKVV